MIQKEVNAEFMNPDYDGTTLPNFMIYHKINEAQNSAMNTGEM